MGPAADPAPGALRHLFRYRTIRLQLDYLLADPFQVGAKIDEHFHGHALALADQAKQDVLGADVVVAKLQRLAQRELEDLLRPRGERDMPGR